MSLYESAHGWKYTNRIYENHLFFRLILIAVYFFFCPIFIGFEIEGFNSSQNLFANFLAFLGLCGGLIFILWVFFVLYEKPKGEKYLEQLTNAIETNLNEQEQEEIWELLEVGGYLLPDYNQRKSLIILCVMFLFELFVVGAWIKNNELVWQPTWVLVIIHWVESHTNWVPVVYGGKFFSFWVRFDQSDLLYQYFQTPQEFLMSEFGKASMFISFLQLLLFLPQVWLMKNIFGKMMGWLGINHIIYRMTNSVWGFIWATSMTAITFLFFFVMFSISAGSLVVDEKIELIINGRYRWFDYVFGMSGFYLFCVGWVLLFVAWIKAVFGFFCRIFWYIAEHF